MAKHFSTTEKSAIKDQLFSKGLKRFRRFGVRAVRVDDLCKDVGISKGSFYTFYPSKEALFISIAQQRDEQHRSDMRLFLQRHPGSPRQFASAFFDMIIEKINSDPMMQLMIEHGEFEYLMRKIPSEMLKKTARTDQEFIEDMTSSLRARNPECTVSTGEIEGLMTLCVALFMQRLMPEPQMANATKLLRQTFIDRLTSPNRTKSSSASTTTEPEND